MIASILGVGTSSFGKQPHLHPAELAWAAVAEALEQAGDGPEIDAVYVGTVFGAPGVAQRALHALGIVDVPILTIENACASGTSAFHESVHAVASGRFERVLALGIEKMTDAFDGPIIPEPTDTEGRSGLALPALYAMSASRYLAKHDVTRDDLAAVAVKNHANGTLNPRAQKQRRRSIDDVLDSRMIAEPLTLLQCCPIADGAAAAVIGPPGSGGDGSVGVRSSVLRSGGLWDHRSDAAWGFELVRHTAELAYTEAGIQADDIDVLECHDAFTIGEIVTTEALGLAETGQGAALVRDGTTSLGGSTPVNPSGGLLARGHPLGATGLAQVAEICWQLTDRAGERQVADASIGVVETMGGGVAGVDGNACVIAVLER
ncbi:MAG: thiolase family protein [Ilumatobacter sp.]|jgi:acetyl-CoA acetyltransferase|uniref:thiolase family protein n=1 Tax=Ilumatobacter sp. TaxID=1967498 RepID=UPI00391AB6D3